MDKCPKLDCLFDRDMITRQVADGIRIICGRCSCQRDEMANRVKQALSTQENMEDYWKNLENNGGQA